MKTNLLKNQKGLTLIELLAVIVILGIIAAIAIPSVNSIISNSRKNAHLESARLMITAAQYKVNNEGINATDTFTLSDLKTDGYIDNVSDPSNKDSDSYHVSNTKVVATKTTNGFNYSVCLGQDGSASYYIGSGTSCVLENDLDGDDVVKNY